jgi:hypothetical protein
MTTSDIEPRPPEPPRKFAKLKRRVKELEARCDSIEGLLADRIAVEDDSHLCDCMPPGVRIDYDPGDGWRLSYDDFLTSLVHFCPYCGAHLGDEMEGL